jgi:bifunctional non-homologous end joining protein LigD
MAFQPMPLSRKPAPFDHPEWIFDLKYDGFRSLATIQNGRCQLVSRNGNSFTSFSSLQRNLAPLYAEKTVLYGETVCLTKRASHNFVTCYSIAGNHVFLCSMC